MRKIVVTFSFVFLLVIGNAAPSFAASFTDVSDDHRFSPHMNYLLEKEIIQGFGDNTFGPDEVVTRAAAAIMLAKALELDTSDTKVDFKDVSPSSKAAGAIQAMSSKGIISGFGDGNYYPDRSVTRAEMAILLAKAFELENRNYFGFTDVTPQMRSYEAIHKVVTAGIATGYTEDKYQPNEPLTRAQFSAFLARTMSEEFLLETKNPGDKKVTTKEAYTISSQLVSDFYERVDELKEANDWGALNPGDPEIAAPVLKNYLTNSFIESDFKVFIESYYCDCDQEIGPKIKDTSLRFTVSDTTADSFKVTVLYLTNMISIEPHFHSVEFKAENGKWKINKWSDEFVITENLKLTQKEVEKAVEAKVVDKFYLEEAKGNVYEVDYGGLLEGSFGIGENDGKVYLLK